MPPTGTEPVKGRLAIATRGVAAIATLPGLFDYRDLVFGRGRASRPADAGSPGGASPARRSRIATPSVMACRSCREDGFLRSVGLGHESPPLSIVIDDLGIYYDASAPSRLEALVGMPREACALARAGTADAAMARLATLQYNQARDAASPIAGPYAPVVDQTRGDASIAHGLAARRSRACSTPRSRSILRCRCC